MPNAHFSQNYTQKMTKVLPGDIPYYDLRKRTDKEG